MDDLPGRARQGLGPIAPIRATPAAPAPMMLSRGSIPLLAFSVRAAQLKPYRRACPKPSLQLHAPTLHCHPARRSTTEALADRAGSTSPYARDLRRRVDA